MFKLITIFFAFVITNIFSFSTDYYQLVMIASNDYLNSIIVTENYQLENSSLDKTVILQSNNKKINISSENVAMIENDNLLYFYNYYDKVLTYTLYNQNLEIVETKNLISEKEIKNIYVCKNDYGIYVMYNDEINDIYGYRIGEETKAIHYPSEKDEILQGLVCDEDYLYVTISKDSISGGMFGNGGSGKSTVVAVIDLNFSVINCVTIDLDYEVKQFELINNIIYLYLGNEVYLLHVGKKNKVLQEITLCNKSDLGEYKYVKTGYNNIIMVVSATNIILYNSKTLEVIKEYTDDKLATYTIKTLNNFIYFYSDNIGYMLDFISMENIIGNSENNSLTSLFGECKFVQKEYLDYYSKSVYGTYEVEIEYLLPCGRSFIVTNEEKIDLKVNVRNDMVYPLGYRLEFNGNALLDGVNIVNNYPVTIEGEHTLVVNGNNAEQVIKFRVSSEQIVFVDEAITSSDVEVKTDEEFQISFDCNNLLKEDIDSIICSGGEIKSFDVIDNTLVLTFAPFPTSGLKEIYIERILYKKYLDINKKVELIDENIIDRTYYINVYTDLPLITLVNIDKKLFEFEVIDTNSLLRVLEVELISNSINYIFRYPLGSTTLVMTGVTPGTYTGIVKALANSSKDDYEYMELYQFTITVTTPTFDIGKLIINKYTNTINKFSIDFSTIDKDNELKMIMVNNNEVIIDTNDSNNIIQTIVFSIIIFIVMGGAGYYIGKRVLKK